MMTKDPNRLRRGGGAYRALLLLAALSSTQVFGQTIWREDFEGLQLGPSVDEEVSGTAVWTKGPPPGWTADDSGVPGVGTDNDGVTEWAGWSFADKNWWIQTAGDQNRSRFTRGSGTVMIADCDEWDDLPHAGSGLSTDERTEQGLWLDTSITTSAIPIAGQPANSLILIFDSSWRPEFDGDYHQSGRVEAIFDTSQPQEVMLWLSDPSSEFFKPDDDPEQAAEGIYTSTNEKVIVPLNNPAGAQEMKLRFTMFDAGNDWWWAVDNLAVGRPPLLSGVSATGLGFTIDVIEALGETVNDASIATQLDGQAVTTTVEREGDVVHVIHDQSPQIFAPGSAHSVQISFTSGDGRQITDTATFIAPTYTTVAATPNSATITIHETSYLTVNEAAGIQLKLDGNAVTGGPVQREDVVANDGTDLPDRLTVRYVSPTPFDSGSAHSVEITFTTASGQQVVETNTFTAPTYVTIPAALGTAAGTGTDAGMRWRTHQIAEARGTTIAEAERQLAGELGPSIHDNSAEVAGGYFEVSYINFDEFAGDAGNFRGSSEINEQAFSDEIIPGIPGLEGGTDNIAGEALAFLEFPTAGIYTMGVNSDDGFQVSVGTTNSPTHLVLGSFDGGRGSSDTIFHFRVDQPGVYFFRLLWFEGSGGANVEWFTIDDQGGLALVNGPDGGNTPIRAFRRRTVAEPEIPSGGAPSIGIARQGAQITIEYTGTLQSADNVNGPYTPVAGATSPYTVPASDTQKFYRASE